MSDFRALNSTTVAICCSIRCYLSHSRIRVLEVLVPLKVGSCAHVAKARQLDSSKCLRMTGGVLSWRLSCVVRLYL